MNESDSSAQFAGAGAARERKLPDWHSHGYQVLRKLSERDGSNHITYLARELSSHCSVVIKAWQKSAIQPQVDYARYLPAIAQLQQLDYPKIPQYLSPFETVSEFCVVRAYQEGVSLAELGTLPPSDVQLIADAVLDILIYLQHVQPTIVHQNIKPENIIIDTEAGVDVYLVDFGIASDSEKVPPLLANTSGFTPPEQIYGRKLTNSTDLYALGVSLVCLLADKSTIRVRQLFDERSRLDFHHLVPKQTPPQLIKTIAKMVAPDERDRFIDATSARYPTHNPKSEQPAPSLSAAMNTDRRKPTNWWRWGLLAGLLLGSGWLLHQFVFNDPDDLSPEQIANNRRIATQAAFADSDRGRLLNEKRCTTCNLSNQNFAKTDLSGAVLSQSILTGSNFTNANLKLAIFQATDLSGADLSNANLDRAALYGAQLLGTRLVNTNLTNAKINYANLKGAFLHKANLTNADLKFAELPQADLSGANLTNADLSDANLAGANLLRANLTGTKLDGANLADAIMPDGSVHR